MTIESYLNRVSQHKIKIVNLPKKKRATEESLTKLEKNIAKRASTKHITVY